MSDNVLAAVKLGIVQRFTHAFTDIEILRLIREKPAWGYQVRKELQARTGVTLRQSKLYPELGLLKKMGFLISVMETVGKNRRLRKVYAITDKGLQYLDIYEDVVREQCLRRDLLQSFVSRK